MFLLKTLNPGYLSVWLRITKKFLAFQRLLAEKLGCQEAAYQSMANQMEKSEEDTGKMQFALWKSAYLSPPVFRETQRGAGSSAEVQKGHEQQS